MKQRYKLYSLLLAAPLFVASCSDDITTSSRNDEVSKEAINISAGVTISQTGTATRGWEDLKDKYYAMTPDTKISLRTEGDWKKAADTNAEKIVKASTATVGDSVTVAATTDPAANEKHYSKLSIANDATPLYWDDFGTADPSNKDAGRKDGLTMYAVAVNGVSDANSPTIPSDTEGKMEELTWDVNNDQQTNDWSKKDLLISNNIQNPANGVTDAADGRYKFANRTEPANLIFKHAMSKITINLKRGNGITDTEVTNGLNQTVTLLNLTTSGKVNITNGAATLDTKKDKITPRTDYNYKNVTPTTTPSSGEVFATYSALVFPDNTFEDKKAVMEVSILGNNTFPVMGDLMVDKAESSSATATSHKLKAGNHYVFNVTINKTGLNVTAQIVDWNTITAEDAPILNVTADRVDTYDGTASVMPANFALYYSASDKKDYTTSKMFGNTNVPVEVKATKDEDKDTYSYSFIENKEALNLYWPNHTTGYFFRGVVALKDAGNTNVTEKTGEGADATIYYPTVTADDTNGDYITLTSGQDDKYNVLIGTHANNVENANDSKGALATTGNVRLTFYHKMAHVTVKLQTAEGTDAVNLGTNTNDMATITLSKCITAGKAFLGDGTVKASDDTNDKKDYVIPTITTTSSDANYPNRASYMVPQSTSGIKLIINANGNNYEIDLSKVKGKDTSASAETASSEITQWNAGTKYVYTITLKKTGYSITAQIENWKKVEADNETIVIQ